MGRKPQPNTYQCSFCGKGQQAVRRLIAGPGGVYICDECIELCNEILREEQLTRAQQSSTPGRRFLQGLWRRKMPGRRHRSGATA